LPRVIFPKPYADAVAKLRVPCGFVLVGAFLWLSAPTLASLATGIPVSVLGLALRGWAAGHLEKDSTLTDSGPYAWVRNPLYLGTLTTAAGLVIASRRWELGLLFAAVFVLIYLPVVDLEEQHLARLFPAYAGYVRRVHKLMPSLPYPMPAESAKHFRWSLYRYNREYQALLGFLAGAALLLWKALRA
jgi:protein-S-isoprenylcysteine O-methyltransferase Ste14